MDDSSTCISSVFSEYEPSVYTEHSDVSNKKNGYDKPLKNGKYIIKRTINGKVKKISLFNTPELPNAKIINAVTGIPYYDDGAKIKYVVGSAQEHDVFRVKYLTLEKGIPGLSLFYDSPEQYERHTQTVLKSDIKNKWHLKRKDYKRKMKKEIEGK